MSKSLEMSVADINKDVKEDGICNYCFEWIGGLRKVQIREHFNGPWQKRTMWICGNCRKALKGFFKYV